MPRMARPLTLVLAAVLCAGSATADMIELRSSVRLVDDSMTVRLRDIAELHGADAERFGDLVLATLTDPTKAVQIPLREIRAKLDDAGVHWGRINLNGRNVVVRPRPRGAAGPVQAMQPLAIGGHEKAGAEETAPQSTIALELIDDATLRGVIARYVAHNLHVDPVALKLGFDARQAALLDTSESGTRFEIQSASSLNSPRVDLAVRVWQNGRITDRHTVTVTPLVHQPIVRARHEIDRNQTIREADIELVQDWLPPHQPTVVSDVQEAVGRVVAVRLKVGEVIRTTQLRRETLVGRGEQVIVRCLVGGSVISLQAEARDDGAEGDTIEFRKVGERETFLATITGRKEAMINLSH